MTNNLSDRLRTNIRAVAKSKRMQLVEVANDAGIHINTLSKFLNGTNDMKIGTLERVTDALGYTVVGLIQWKAK